MQSLNENIQRIAKQSPYYKKQLAHLAIESLSFPEDLHQLPFTHKEDLSQYNADFLSIAKEEVRDWVTTSGTMGDPVWFALSEKDLNRLAKNEAGSYRLAGLKRGQKVLLTTTMDRRFMAGLAYFFGGREYGLSFIRNGPGIPEMQWDSIRLMQPDLIIAVPSFLLKIAEYARANGFDPSESSLKKAICIGENIRNEMLEPNELALRIASEWPGLELIGTYAGTEMSTAFTECTQARGMHLQEDLIYAEFLNELNEPVAEGELGELVITHLGVEAMPLIRFRTGDLMRHYRSKCPCGNPSLRIGPVEGRKQQMIKYKGTTLYPPALFNVLHESSEIKNFQIHLFRNQTGTDELHIWVGFEGNPELILPLLKNRFKAKIRVSPIIKQMEIEVIEKSKWPEKNRKALLFIDHRQEN